MRSVVGLQERLKNPNLSPFLLHADISPDSFVRLLCFSFLVLVDSSKISVFFKHIM